jgi:hypothetical protein
MSEELGVTSGLRPSAAQNDTTAKPSGFQLDTSGHVLVNGKPVFWDASRYQTVEHLSPFVQGYARDGLFRSMVRTLRTAPADANSRYERWAYEIPVLNKTGGGYASEADALAAAAKHLRYDMLPPETLARIMEDCAKLKAELDAEAEWLAKRTDTELGAWAFHVRQSNGFADLQLPPPPLSLNDDGKVVFL